MDNENGTVLIHNKSIVITVHVEQQKKRTRGRSSVFGIVGVVLGVECYRTLRIATSEIHSSRPSLPLPPSQTLSSRHANCNIVTSNGDVNWFVVVVTFNATAFDVAFTRLTRRCRQKVQTNVLCLLPSKIETDADLLSLLKIDFFHLWGEGKIVR